MTLRMLREMLERLLKVVKRLKEFDDRADSGEVELSDLLLELTRDGEKAVLILRREAGRVVVWWRVVRIVSDLMVVSI